MIIIFSPQFSGNEVTFIKNGNTLEIDGEVLDLSLVPANSLADNDAINNDNVLRVETDEEGEPTITLLYPYAENTDVNRFPANLIDPEDGEIKPIESAL